MRKNSICSLQKGAPALWGLARTVYTEHRGTAGLAALPFPHTCPYGAPEANTPFIKSGQTLKINAEQQVAAFFETKGDEIWPKVTLPIINDLSRERGKSGNVQPSLHLWVAATVRAAPRLCHCRGGGRRWHDSSFG